MFVATVVLSIVLAALLVVSARGKLTHDATIMRIMRHVGASDRLVRVLAYLEIAGAVGLLVGLVGPLGWIGVLAGVGVVLYFLGALVAHLRVGDKNVVAPAVPLVLAVVVLALRSASA
ncbi:DoxX family protein [Pseudokineococcus basanitobsidens]|uniref:DoxX family protein n=1 Tax=Pseudokineococcus basanitobsidens TaxID=1926649 RepID=A0ABU8RNE4_9ACTN